MPAAFTTTSTPPNSRSAVSNSPATAVSSATSAWTAIARPPALVTAATAAFASAVFPA